jgi:uncharacterized RDD family membrane protein YckC
MRSVPGGASETPRYAGFLQRFAAFIIDVILLSVATGILAAVTFGSWALAWMFLPWVYEAVMVSSTRQATLGKMALGLIVTDMNGNRVSFGRATGRHFAKYVSAFILFIGFIMAAFTEKKQAFHDLMVQTLVMTQ